MSTAAAIEHARADSVVAAAERVLHLLIEDQAKRPDWMVPINPAIFRDLMDALDAWHGGEE